MTYINKILLKTILLTFILVPFVYASSEQTATMDKTNVSLTEAWNILTTSSKASKWYLLTGADDDTLITVMAKENGEKLFSNFSYKDAKFDMTMEDFEKKEPSIKVTKLCGGRVSVSGMNGAIPINSVKMFLETRGIDPNYFGWELAPESYWEK